MRRALILAMLAMPIAAYAQEVTDADRAAAATSLNDELLKVITTQRAQIQADVRERIDMMKQLKEAEKAKPTTPNNAPKP